MRKSGKFPIRDSTGRKNDLSSPGLEMPSLRASVIIIILILFVTAVFAQEQKEGAQPPSQPGAEMPAPQEEPPGPHMPPGHPGYSGTMPPYMPPGSPGTTPSYMPPEQPALTEQQAADEQAVPDEQPVQMSAASQTYAEEDGVKAGEKPSRISLDLKGIDIIELLRILSLKTGLTIAPTKNVSGRVNIYLNNLSFDDAFNIILLSQDLAAERKGDIISVMTSSEYEKMYGKKYTDKRRVKRLKLNYAKPSVVFNALGQIKSDIGKIIVDESSGAIILIDVPERLKLLEEAFNRLDQPLDTAIFDLKYAKPADIKAHLSGAITPGLGEVFVDEKSGKVMVSDMPDKISKIRRIVRAFDSPPLEVFIEAEIIELLLNDQYERGVDWQKVFGDEEWIKWAKLTGLTLAGAFPATSTFITSAFQKVTVGTLNANKYTAMLKFLQKYGNTKTLSRPRLAVVDNQEAKIMVGKRDVYVSQTLSQAQTTTVTSESVQFVDVGVKLNVVPNISSDGFIIMKIKPEVSTVDSVLTTYLQSQIPIISTSEAETVVKVKDGAMIMIAGLMKEENVDDIKGWPYLSKVKALDVAFGNRSTQKRNTELIIFITPHIITGEAPVEDHGIEDVYPVDVLPKPIKEDLIDEGISRIGAKKEKPLKDYISKREKAAGAKSSTAEEDLMFKMKGSKKY